MIAPARRRRPKLKVFNGHRRPTRSFVAEFKAVDHRLWSGIGLTVELFTFAEWELLPAWERDLHFDARQDYADLMQVEA